MSGTGEAPGGSPAPVQDGVFASVTEDDVLTALRAFLSALLPPGVEVIRGQDNRVGEPQGDDYLVMTTMLRTRLGTNTVTFADTPGAGTREIRQSTEITVQVDVHGPNSANTAQVVSTLLRDGDAWAQMAQTPEVCAQPLYTSEPRQAPFVNAESQYEDRWTVDVVLQFKPAIVLPQLFADTVRVTPAIIP